MTHAVISDVHSNLEALEATLEDIRRRGIQRILFLGDAVGYGPDPDRCVELLRGHCRVLLAGNHDQAVTGETPLEYFNEHARAAALWTRSVISGQNLEFLRTLKLTEVLRGEGLFLVHSTPREPGAWHYIFTLNDAERNFHYFSERVCLLGHSHVPFIVEKKPSGELILFRERAAFSETGRYIVNVGSVGQPRDGDPRAAYAVLTPEGVEIVRVEYEFTETQRKMKQAGLPDFLIERLQRGI